MIVMALEPEYLIHLKAYICMDINSRFHFEYIPSVEYSYFALKTTHPIGHIMREHLHELWCKSLSSYMLSLYFEWLLDTVTKKIRKMRQLKNVSFSFQLHYFTKTLWKAILRYVILHTTNTCLKCIRPIVNWEKKFTFWCERVCVIVCVSVWK